MPCCALHSAAKSTAPGPQNAPVPVSGLQLTEERENGRVNGFSRSLVLFQKGGDTRRPPRTIKAIESLTLGVDGGQTGTKCAQMTADGRALGGGHEALSGCGRRGGHDGLVAAKDGRGCGRGQLVGRTGGQRCELGDRQQQAGDPFGACLHFALIPQMIHFCTIPETQAMKLSVEFPVRSAIVCAWPQTVAKSTFFTLL